MKPDESGHPHRWRILAVLILSLLMMVMDNTIMNVALRTIADPVLGIGASQDELQWIINSYTLVFAGPALHRGRLADRHGRRRILMRARRLRPFLLRGHLRHHRRPSSSRSAR